MKEKKSFAYYLGFEAGYKTTNRNLVFQSKKYHVLFKEGYKDGILKLQKERNKRK